MWEELYEEAVKDAIKELENVDGVFVAYNANIDLIRFLSEEDVQRLVDMVDSRELIRRMTEYPRRIDTPLDLIARLMISIEGGKAAEVPVYAMEIDGWLRENVGFDEKRLGGQAGIITHLLSRLDIRNVIAYIPWLSPEIAELIERDNVFCPVIKNGKPILVPPTEACEKGKGKTNWILEYRKGMNITVGDKRIVCPRDNRLILSFRPPWIRIEMKNELLNRIHNICAHIDGAILSGYQMIKKEYEDGTTYHHYVRNSVEVIKRLREVSPNAKVHVEFTSIQDREIRETILREIVKLNVHSLGLDAVEVANALNVLGHEEIASRIIKRERTENLFEGTKRLFQELELERVHLHALGHYICIRSKEDGVEGAEVERDALLFASALTASRAMKGDVKSREDALLGLHVPVYNDIDYLLEFLTRYEGCETVMEGIVEGEDFYCVIVPTKVVDNPVATVGLGDTISASAFVVNLSKLSKDKSLFCPVNPQN
jgi:ADP-dependent phosphofructokinase/glucokinase